MNQQQSTLRRRRMRMVAGAAVAVLALGGVTACEDKLPAEDGGSDTQGPGDDEPDAGDEDGGDTGGEEDGGDTGGEGSEDPAEADDGFLGAGEAQVYANGVEITLGAAEEYEPGKYVDYDAKPYKVDISVTNNGDADFDLSLLISARAGDAGVEADRIYDSEKLDDLSHGTLKAGRTVSGNIAFDVPEDAAFLDVETRFVGARDMDAAFWNLRL
jgi:hypothetical protein